MTEVTLTPERLRRWAANRVTFYLGIPLALAVLYTLLRSGLAALMPAPQGLLFWALLMVPSWLAGHALASLAHVVLRPWRPPLWIICTLGCVGQALLFSPAYRSFHRWAQDALVTSGRFDSNWPLPSLSVEYIALLAWTMAPGIALFIGVNVFYDRVLGVPRFRYDDAAPAPRAAEGVGQLGEVASDRVDVSPPATAGPPPVVTGPEPAVADAPSRPALLRQSRLPETALVYALSAEEHYVRIFSDAGTDMVRYRFSDALDEFAAMPAGMQVHRSWWVRLDRAQHWRLRGRLFELEFEQGLRVPISLAFREAALMRAPHDVRVRARHGARRGAGAVDRATERAGGIR